MVLSGIQFVPSRGMLRTFAGYILLSLLFCGIPQNGNAQLREKADSLQRVLPEAKDTARVSTLLSLAHTYLRLNTDTAYGFAILAKNEAVALKFPRGEALAEKELASIYYNRGDMPLAEETAKNALIRLQNLGTAIEKADVTNLLGLILMGQAKYYEAEKYYTEALALYEACRDSAGVGIALHNMGVVNFYEGEYDEVARYYMTSLRLAEAMKYESLITNNQLNLGLLASVQREYEKAKRYIKKALVIYRKTGDRQGEANAISHLGTVYFNEGSLDSSLYTHMEALAVFRETGADYGISQALSNIADIFVERKNYVKAKEYYEESIVLRRKNEDQYGLSISYTGMAKVNYGLGNLETAKAYYDSALVISKTIGTRWHTGEVYKSIADFQEKSGNYKAAYDAMKNYSGIRDSLFSDEKTKVVQELQARYDTEKKEQDLVLEKNKVQLLQKENRLFLITAWAIGIISVLIISLSILLYNRSRIREQKNREISEKNRQLAESRQLIAEAQLAQSQAEQEKIRSELDFKRKELTQLALHINQQNEFLESLRQSLKTGTSPTEARSMEAELETKLNLGKQRENFEMNIDLINEDFYRNLQSRFPSLNENEKKLCAMLRLNLSSKEIASILNITSKSVDMNRYRLRKKLDLPAETDLVKFLGEI